MAQHRRSAASARQSPSAAFVGRRLGPWSTGANPPALAPVVPSPPSSKLHGPVVPALRLSGVNGDGTGRHLAVLPPGPDSGRDVPGRAGNIAPADRSAASSPRQGSSSVPKGRASLDVPIAGMTPQSLVLVTLQSAHSGVHVLGAVPSVGGFTVHLSKKVARETSFAWLVLDR